MKMWLGRVSLCPGATNRDIQPRMFSPFLPFARYILRSQLPIRLKLSFPTALLASKLNISALASKNGVLGTKVSFSRVITPNIKKSLHDLLLIFLSPNNIID